MDRVAVAASILTADFGNLYRVVRKLERAGVDRLHLDVMDGHFVENITFGPTVVAAIRRLTALPLDVHLMIAEPSRYIQRFIDAGGDSLTFHVEVAESDDQKRETLRLIGEARRQAGLAISPDTPVSAVRPFLDDVSLLMIMTVHPGWGGQRFLEDRAPKIAEARALLGSRPDAAVHVDGGVSGDTAAVVGREGVDVCVVGSALFQRRRDTASEVERVRRAAQQARPS
ncbi:MAG TPA: ribulose-phosphate 3-epimerase [Candidatus Limnocylindrales bacterium]|nr:ribulose-phosphate 3-epimerase [Candidatus Limnocylindrales bacterium]